MAAPDRVRPMTAHDLDWLVDAARACRESLVPYAPRFWNPAADATERHRGYLAGLIEDPSVLTVRIPDGYLIAAEHGTTWLVDDADVTGEGDWRVEGAQLLRYAQDNGGALRFSRADLRVQPLDAAQVWASPGRVLVAPGPRRHRALPSASGRPRTTATAHGRLVDAPPVDPVAGAGGDPGR